MDYPIQEFLDGPSCYATADIAYSAQQTDSSELPEYIIFNEALKRFEIDIDGQGIDEDEQYTVELKGLLPNVNYATTEFEITIQRCSLSTLTAVQNDDIEFIIGQPELIVPLLKFDKSIEDCGVTYELQDTKT